MVIRLLGSIALSLLVFATALPEAVSTQEPTNYVVGPQDILTIAVFDQEDLGGKYPVDADGTFTFP